MNNTSPLLLYEYIVKWRDCALSYDINEIDFWNMTLAEVERVCKHKQAREKREEQAQAVHNYVLADLIGRSINRIYSSSATMPDISEVYPTLFDSKEIKEQKQEQRQKISALRFKQFADSFNAKFSEKGE